jgi:hypothetical protein
MAADRLRRGLRLVSPTQAKLEASPPAAPGLLGRIEPEESKPLRDSAAAAARRRAAQPVLEDRLRFEDTPAFRRVVRLSLGPAGPLADELGRCMYDWLLERCCWPQGSEFRSCLRAAGSELRFIAEQLALREQVRVCRKLLKRVDVISLALGEEIPQATRGAFRDTLLLHVIDLRALDVLETIGLRLWEWAVKQKGFGKAVVPGAVADLHVLADYLGNLARLAPDPVNSHFRRLARLPVKLAAEVRQLAEGIEGRRRSDEGCRRRGARAYLPSRTERGA